MYIKCLEKNLETGITTRPCEIAYKERECLYYEGATGKVGRGLDDLLGKIMMAIVMSMIKKAISKMLTMGCKPPTAVVDNTETCATGLKVGICAAIQAFEG